MKLVLLPCIPRGLRWASLTLPLAALGVLPGANQAAPGQLADPTRPPPGLIVDSAPTAAGGQTALLPPRPSVAAPASAVPPPPPPAPPPPLPELQSLQVDRRGAATAMVDGRLVRVGDQVAERQVLAVDASGVLLRGPGGVAERLTLWRGGGIKLPAGSLQASALTAYAADPAATAASAAPPADPGIPVNAMALEQRTTRP